MMQKSEPHQMHKNIHTHWKINIHFGNMPEHFKRAHVKSVSVSLKSSLKSFRSCPSHVTSLQVDALIKFQNTQQVNIILSNLIKALSNVNVIVSMPG